MYTRKQLSKMSIRELRKIIRGEAIDAQMVNNLAILAAELGDRATHMKAIYEAVARSTDRVRGFIRAGAFGEEGVDAFMTIDGVTLGELTGDLLNQKGEIERNHDTVFTAVDLLGKTLVDFALLGAGYGSGKYGSRNTRKGFVDGLYELPQDITLGNVTLVGDPSEATVMSQASAESFVVSYSKVAREYAMNGSGVVYSFNTEAYGDGYVVKVFVDDPVNTLSLRIGYLNIQEW